MERRQPYTEVPYTPLSGDPVPGSPTSDMHHLADTASHHHSGAHPNARYVGESGQTHSFSASESQVAAAEKKEKPRELWYKGATMVKRIIGIAVVAILIVGGYFWYKNHKANQDAMNGEIYSNDLTPGSVSRSGEASRAVAKPIPGTSANTSSNGLTIPTTDSIPANPPNGAAFSGSGKFQVYRQGNLTWRVNTETGESCVLFATEDEWRKPIVFNHGCNAS